MHVGSVWKISRKNLISDTRGSLKREIREDINCIKIDTSRGPFSGSVDVPAHVAPTVSRDELFNDTLHLVRKLNDERLSVESRKNADIYLTNGFLHYEKRTYNAAAANYTGSHKRKYFTRRKF